MKQQLRSNFKQAKGFTLIELIIVIIILGILAVTAAPKFIDVQKDARISVLQGAKASLQSASTMVHAKALIAGQTGSTGSVSVGTSTITLTNGYPDADQIASLVDFDSVISEVSGSAGTFEHATASDSGTCRVVYAEAGTGVQPQITITPDGC